MWSRANGNGMRSHFTPGATSIAVPGAGGSGQRMRRALSLLPATEAGATGMFMTRGAEAPRNERMVRRSMVIDPSLPVKSGHADLYGILNLIGRRASRLCRNVLPCRFRNVHHFRPRPGIRADHAHDSLLRGRGPARAPPQRP